MAEKKSLSYWERPCPICQQDHFEVLNRRQQRITLKSEYHFHIYEGICTACGLVYQNPIPTQESLDRYYSEKYLHSVGSPDYDLTARISLLKKHCGSRRYVHEIGSNEGSFLAAAAKEGFEVSGYDPIDNDSSSFTEEQPKPEIVVANHVLEHIAQPIEFLKNLKTSMAEDGIVIFEVPNLHYYSIYTSAIFHEHLFHFSPENTQQIFSLAGFECLDLEFNMVSRPLGFTIIAKASNQPTSTLIRVNEYLSNKKYYLAAIEKLDEKLNKRKKLLSESLNTPKDRVVAFWGANIIMQDFIEQVPKHSHERLLLVDSNHQRWDKPFNQNLPLLVHAPETLTSHPRVERIIICATGWAQEITKKLQDFGYNSSQIFQAPI